MTPQWHDAGSMSRWCAGRNSDCSTIMRNVVDKCRTRTRVDYKTSLQNSVVYKAKVSKKWHELLNIPQEGWLFLPGEDKKSICMFLDAATFEQHPYKKHQLLVFTLPQIRRPHQQRTVHRLGRWLGPDNAQD